MTRPTVVMPAYNEAATIRELARRVLEYADRLIVVDDGSTDGSVRALAGLDVLLLHNQQNQGKGCALVRGLRRAAEMGDGPVVTLDADGQHEPRDIPRLMATHAQYPQHIVIAARRSGRANAPLLRRFANRFADFWISWAAGYPIHDSQSGFRLYPAALLRELPLDATPGRGFVLESRILIDAASRGYYSTEVAVDSIYPPNRRRSHYRAIPDTWSIVRMVAGRLLRRGMFPTGLLRSLRLLPLPQPRFHRK